jgi:hypothetical protein
MCLPFPLRELGEQQPREGEHDERQHEQHEAELDQRRAMHGLGGLVELVGERGRDRVAGREQRRADPYALPMTNVTAIVSPSARPEPSMIPPITPTFVYGSTMFQTTSHVVAPSRTPTP